ncbi:N-acetyltransferase [Pantoea sp. Cy-639]|uniref:N-acetyltransferase n=1 Tax=Pantoea sp. Cy-639 TaxID=2608360 RepID=UPI00141E2E1D|nr:N-acetyltransferase [Pantoea sp. Cy-639]NIF19656.1 N-acetyltransferase [Pantoea sp. Cy-639]
MIRPYTPSDSDAVLQIWLEASIRAHHFIPKDFWLSQVEAMRTQYIPAATTFVHEHDGEVQGFVSLHGHSLAALFISPAAQGQGLGTRLVDYVKTGRDSLELSVYRANERAIAFYLRHGFSIIAEGVDEHTGAMELSMRWQAGVSPS